MIVRASHQDPTTGAIESGRQSATERTHQDVQERLLTQWTKEVFRIQRVIQGPSGCTKSKNLTGRRSKGRFTQRIYRKSRWTTTCYGASKKYLNDVAGKC